MLTISQTKNPDYAPCRKFIVQEKSAWYDRQIIDKFLSTAH